MINTCSVGIADILPHKLTLIQISRSSFSLPADVILKLPGGSIEAHRSILAAVSPVFEKTFYGNVKEGKSMTVDLPNDNYKIMSLLVDFVYQGKCELKDLDDIFPVLEAFDKYQINKIPFYHMCSEFILAQIEPSNYLTLLPKFASLMSEEGIRKAANKVMFYTNSDFITSFDSTKDLPEEVLLQLLQMDITNHEIDVFEFLVKWHDYQTKDLRKSLKLSCKLFQCIRYSLIIPQILTSKVIPRCDLVNKQLIFDAYHYIYNSCSPLGEYNGKECSQEPIGPTLRKPKCSLKIEWVYRSNATVKHDTLDEYKITYASCSCPASHNSLIMSSPLLRNGTYTFSVLGITVTPPSNYSHPDPGAPLSITITSQPNNCLYYHPVISDSLITVYTHDEYLFLKVIEGDKVKSTTSIRETSLCCICINNLLPYITHHSYSCSFSIHNHVQ